ncbi:MAG: tetratricopeptide repeat protein, partial [SAR324 cluster bacterium]|nr:tetratricopeptide repeat protein [SAR324 cluster bacterium]
GSHLWAERYDRKLEDMFALQDEITEEVVTALDVNLVAGERAGAFRRFLKTHEARRIYREGLRMWQRPTKEGIPEVRRLFEQVIRLEPQAPNGYSGMGWTHWWEVRFGWSPAPEDSLKSARDFAEKAIELDDTFYAAPCLVGCICLFDGNFEKAITNGRLAKNLVPNHTFVVGFLAEILLFSGEVEEAIAEAELSLRLSPVAPAWVFAVLGAANAGCGRFEEALAAAREAMKTDPEFLEGHLVMADALVGLGRVKEARAKAKEILKAHPRFSLAAFAKTQPFKEPAHLERYLGNLRKAGLPE